MSLKKYRSKRDFKKTAEPPALIVKKKSGGLRFCIQKHAARRLHYDFRIECYGVLISWAVPKGPSLNPKDKRLAMKVEDHPLEYQYFEGVIPKGNYGAGTVEIWDKGTYTAPNIIGRKETEEYISEGIRKGHFAIELDGEKLNGEFIFQKLKKDPEDNSWLLIKKADAEATSEPLEPKVSKKKMRFPDFIQPMLATLISKPFNDQNWLFEIKWDGFRTLAFINKGEVALKSRNKNLLNHNFPKIVEELEQVKESVILDGEVVVLDEKGRSDFQLMQNYQRDRKGALYYYLFDFLFKDGSDLRELPLTERKTLLKTFVDKYQFSNIRFSDHILEKGEAFFQEASKNHLEGIIGKKINSPYLPFRSRDWVKIKTLRRQEVVICGFTQPRGSRKKFGSLIVGVYNDQDTLSYAGNVGGGFNFASLKEVYKKLEPLIQKNSPFKNKIKTKTAATWVKPKLICEVSFSEWTKENIMRQPIFQGLRTDKPPKKVKREIASSPTIVLEKEVKKKIGKVTLTHLDKIFWPKEKITKRELIEYYQSISAYILPYLKKRPQTLHRFPDGIEGLDFYQKEIDSSVPSWVSKAPVQHEGKLINYLLVNDLNSLLYAVNLGNIDFHPFISQIDKLDFPDYCVIDLDPHGITFENVVEVALVYHEILEKVSVDHYLKTSGGNGLHIYIPLKAKYDYAQSRQFAEIISFIVHKRMPKITSMERDPKKRPKKIYLDCLQNRFGQTVVAPYSVRPRPGAKVSMPLSWNELNSKLDPANFNLLNTPKRLKEKGDLFKPVLGKGIDLKSSLKKIQELL